jgi:hypothetical protein
MLIELYIIQKHLQHRLNNFQEKFFAVIENFLRAQHWSYLSRIIYDYISILIE